MALRNFCGDAYYRVQMRKEGALRTLVKLLYGTDMEATLEALMTLAKLVQPDGIRAADELVRAGAIEAIKTMFDTRPKTGEIILAAQEVLKLLTGSLEGKRVMVQTGADK